MTPRFPSSPLAPLSPLSPLADTLRLGPTAAEAAQPITPAAPAAPAADALTEPAADTAEPAEAAAVEAVEANKATEADEAVEVNEAVEAAGPAEAAVQTAVEAAAPQQSVPAAPARTTGEEKTEKAETAKAEKRGKVAEEAEAAASNASESSKVSEAAETPAVTDSLEAAPADTLLFPAVDTLSPVEPFNPVLTAEQTFGTLSELTSARTPALPRREQLTDQPVFQGIVLVLLIAYMLLLCAHLRDILGLFLRKRSDYLRDGGHALNNGRAIQTAVIVGMLTLAAVGVRLGEQSAGEAFHSLELLSLTTGAVFGVALVQCGALALIGRITLTTELTRAVIHFKALYFSVATLIAMPAALLLIFCPPGEGRFWFWTLCALSGSVALLFLKETFMLFLRKKISILHWFLYLCTVECFPVSLVWLLAIRH